MKLPRIWSSKVIVSLKQEYELLLRQCDVNCQWCNTRATWAFWRPFDWMSFDPNATFEMLQNVFQRHFLEIPFESQKPLGISNAVEMRMLALSHAVSGCRIYKNYYLQVKLFFEKLAPNYFLFVVVNYPLVHDYKVWYYQHQRLLQKKKKKKKAYVVHFYSCMWVIINFVTNNCTFWPILTFKWNFFLWFYGNETLQHSRHQNMAGTCENF